MKRTVSLAVLLALLVAIGLMFYQVVLPFILPVLLGGMVAIVSQPLFRYFLMRTGSASAASGLTCTVLAIGAAGPMLIVTFLTAVELVDFGSHVLPKLELLTRQQTTTDGPPPVIPESVSKWIPFEIDSDEGRERLQLLADKGRELLVNSSRFLAQSTLSLLSSATSLLISGGMFFLALYFFLADGRAMLEAVQEMIPLPVEYQMQLFERFSSVTQAVLSSTLVAAAAQGVTTGLACSLLGFGHFFVFTMIATVSAMIPVAGTWVVWLPCSISLFAGGHYTAAIGLVLFGTVVISLMDNIIRTYLLQSGAQLHPLIAFVSVLGALQTFGLFGVFLGPVVAACFSALLELFNSELKHWLAERPHGQRKLISDRHRYISSAGFLNAPGITTGLRRRGPRRKKVSPS